MSNWNTVVYTTKGLALLSKLVAGSALSITRILSGAGLVPEDELQDQTDVTDPKQQLLGFPVEVRADAQAEIPMMLKNTGLAEGYTAHQIGVFATDPDEGEILLIIAQDDTGEDVPAEGASLMFSVSYTLVTQFYDASQVILQAAAREELTYGEAGELFAPVSHVEESAAGEDGVHGFRYDETDDVFEIYDRPAGTWIPIAVGAPKLQGITVTTLPVKTVYRAGDFFDAAGMVVTAGYTQSLSAPVTGYSITPDRPLGVADTFVTVAYTANGITCTVQQAVSVSALVQITVTVPPDTTRYVSGSRFDPTGMAVRAAYADGSTQDVTAGCTFSPPGPLGMDDTVITVSYATGGTTKTTVLMVTVLHRLMSVSITSPPDQTAYTEEETFIQAGMAVRANYHDGSYSIVTGYTVSPAGPLTLEDTAVTVAYTENGVTQAAIQAITVAPKAAVAYFGSSTDGTVEPLYAARDYFLAAHVGNYALFSSGQLSTRMEAYDDKLTHLQAPVLRYIQYLGAAAETDGYALFAGGKTGFSGSTTHAVDAYDRTLMRTAATNLSMSRTDLTGASNGGYALFAGGYNSYNRNEVEAYDSSLTRTTPAKLSVSRSSMAATSVGDYALFGGGGSGSEASDAVEAYNSTLVRTTAPALTAARYMHAAATTGNYALFAGGYGTSYPYPQDIVDIYDENLLRLTSIELPDIVYRHTATSKDGYAIFGGGMDRTGPAGRVEVYDNTLTRILPEELSVPRYDLAASHAGDYVLFASGYVRSPSAYSFAVDAYTIN